MSTTELNLEVDPDGLLDELLELGRNALELVAEQEQEIAKLRAEAATARRERVAHLRSELHRLLEDADDPAALSELVAVRSQLLRLLEEES